MSTQADVIFYSAHLPQSLELDDWEILEDFYLTFLQQLDDFLPLVDQPTSPLSIEEQRHHAHKLSSSCRMVGAAALARLLETLEDLCRSENTEQQREKLLANLASVGEATRDQVAQYVTHASKR